MPNKSHWPFSDDSDARAAWSAGRTQEAEQARSAERAALRQRARHDRLLVGGRAHTKKRGLS